MTARSPYAESADDYHAKGWSPLPLPLGKKTPPPKGFTGALGVPPTPQQIEEWKAKPANVALRLPSTVLGFDVDDGYGGKTGSDQLAELEERAGEPLPPTWKSTSRGDDLFGPGESAIYLFRVPAGFRAVSQIADSIEAIQSHHRYVVAAPSTHPNGNTYRWYDDVDEPRDDAPDVDDLAELPPQYYPLIGSFATATGGLMATPEQVSEFVTSRTEHSRPGALKGVESKLARSRGARHGTLLEVACWIARESAAGLYPALDGYNVLRKWWLDVMDDESRRDGTEFDDAIAWAVGQADAESDRVATIRETSPVLLSGPLLDVDPSGPLGDPEGLQGPETTPQAPIHLPDEFWSERSILQHVRTAAHARMVSADALLHITMARVAALNHHSVQLPATIGGAMGLSYFVLAVGPPESGKSTAMAVGRELVPVPADLTDQIVDMVPVGSGEGLVEILFDTEDVIDDSGKKKATKVQNRHNAIVFIDEGQVVSDIGLRSGSTLLPTIRTIYTSGVLGNANAAMDRKRIVPAGSYVYGIVMGLQPELSSGLLGDANAGTPQRFAWAYTTDPGLTMKAPGWPGVLPWSRQTFSTLDAQLKLTDTIVEELRANRLAIMTGAKVVEQMEAHNYLVRLKMAAILALMEKRWLVNDDDWHLAGVMAETSRNVRVYVQAIVKAQQARVGAAKIRGAVAESAAVEADLTQRSLNRASRAVARAAHRRGVLTAREAAQCIAGRDRQNVTVEQALDRALAEGWIAIDGEHWKRGRSKP